MGSFRRLTVAQSMALIFCAGLSVAVVFASASLLGDLADRRALAQDRGLVAMNDAIGSVVHELQRERALTSAWLSAPDAALTSRLAEQRARTDAVLLRAAPHLLRAGPAPGAGGPPLAQWLAGLRGRVDVRAVSPGPFRDAMSTETERLIWTVARSATSANSGRVALLTNTLASLLAAKDAIEHERASGAAILAASGQAGADLSVDLQQMQRQIPVTETWLRSYRLVADDDGRSSLDLWEHSTAFRRFADARSELLSGHLDGAVEGLTLEDWMVSANALIDDLRGVGLHETERMSTLLSEELRAARHDIAGDVALLAALLIGFGALAHAMMRRVDRSIRGLIGAARRLSSETTSSPVARCPQRDLDQLAQALDVLRCALLERRVSLETAEALRSSVGEELDRVFAAMDRGAPHRRVDLLGLDAHGAVLARGVNRLLDRIEGQERRDTGT